MVRAVFGFIVTLAGFVMLDRVGVLYSGFPYAMIGMAPVVLAGGLLMGLHEEPPPWRRRGAAR